MELCGAEARGDRAALLFQQVRQHQSRPGGGSRFGEGAAEPACGAGDQDPLAGEGDRARRHSAAWASRA